MSKFMNKYGNLHTHTRFSDAIISPDELVKQVLSTSGLGYFALTDHDSLSGIEPVFRALESQKTKAGSSRISFIPGIELTLTHQKSGFIVHLLGLFPQINSENYREELTIVESVLGEYCRYRCMQRGFRDLDERVRKAYEVNLDGLEEAYQSPDTIIRRLRSKADCRNKKYYKEADKALDVIRHPIPVTYQVLIDFWEELMPDSSRERITLYILRPDKAREDLLAENYRASGMSENSARVSAAENQGILSHLKHVNAGDKDIDEGIHLIQEAGGIPIIAHPAIDHNAVTFIDYDNLILYPMIAEGLRGIEVYYPYDKSYRDVAIKHYRKIAQENCLLISGGTDFHGDNRCGLDAVVLTERDVLRIVNYSKR